MRPTPDAPARPRVGVYGGTFDPPHIGHLIIASETRQALGLDEVVFVPAGRPPHKDPAAVSSAADRLAMLRAAVADEPSFRVDTVELEREGASYTVDTLAGFRAERPEAEFWFIMGADSLLSLDTWRDPDRLLAMARAAVSPRPGTTLDLHEAARRVPATSDRVDVVPAPLVAIASRELRRRVREGSTIRYLVPPAVERYIMQNGLYRDEASIRGFPERAVASPA